MSENRIEEEVPEIPEGPKEKKEWHLRVNYEWIVKNLPFILFLSLIALLYIANGHYAVKNIREINKLTSEVKELNWRYLDAKSGLMLRSKMSEVSQGVTDYGLQVPLTPPLNIKTNK